MKKKLAMLFYSIGCVVGQLILLVQSMRQAGKQMKEFDRFMKKIEKARKLENK